MASYNASGYTKKLAFYRDFSRPHEGPIKKNNENKVFLRKMGNHNNAKNPNKISQIKGRNHID